MTSAGTKGSFLSQPMVKSVLVYRNGDPFFPGRRIVINEKKVSNFEVFLKEVTGGVKAPFGAVRNIYTPRAGHRVRQLEELQSGEQYVAGGREAFKKLNYLDIGETKKKPAEVNNEIAYRLALVDFGATERFAEALVHGTGDLMDGDGVYKWGFGSFDPSSTLRECKYLLSIFLRTLINKQAIVTSCQQWKIAGVDPMERCNILAFTVHAGYDKTLFGEFCTNMVQYLLNLLGDTLFQTPRNKGVIYALCQVKPVTHSRITASARFRKPLQEPYTIFLIANGDLISPVVRLLIPRKTLNHWDHILEMVTAKVTLRSGAVHRLYTLDGKLVQDGSDLENGQFYVAVGRERLKKLPYGDLLFSKSTIRRPQGSKASVLPPIVGSRKSKGSGNDRQSKSTVGSSDPGENSYSPQPPKGKDKKCHNPEDSVSRGHFSNKSTKGKQTRVAASTGVLQDNGDGIYKVREEQSEMWGAAEVQEDEDTHVEVPLDQRPAETVDEEENAEEEDDREEEEAYKLKEEYPEMNGEESREIVKKRNKVEENEKKLNGNYKHNAEETENVDQPEEEELTHLNSKINEENGEGIEQLNSQGNFQSKEDIKEKEYFDSQNQVDSHIEKTSTNPRVTITSPQENGKKGPEQ